MPIKIEFKITVVMRKNGELKVYLAVPETVRQIIADERLQDILEELTIHPTGVSFNKLYLRLKDKMARQTLKNKLSWLLQNGFVQKLPEKPRKGQRVLYKLPFSMGCSVEGYNPQVLSFQKLLQQQEGAISLLRYRGCGRRAPSADILRLPKGS